MKGKITQWHDDKGYGFIQIDNSSQKIFCHISNFVQKQPRPTQGENVSFDIVTNEKGKTSANKIRYLDRPTHQEFVPKTRHERKNTANKHQNNSTVSLGGLVSGIVSLIFVGLIGYQVYQFAAAKLTPKQANKPQPINTSAPLTNTQYRCDGRKHCSQMKSCEEAKWFLRNCADTQMDGDGDGIPCESSLCSM